jgi:flavorubredoxin
LGLIPVNAYVLKAKQPVLVDTGLIHESDEFMAALQSVIDPKDLKWLWLTHTDQDHVGSLHRLVKEVPHLKVITSFLGFGKMGLFGPLPPDRVYLLNPGQTLDVGDRTLTAVRPPTYDAPETTGFFDSKSEVFFSSDCFGAVVQAPAQTAADIDHKALHEGQTVWATIDSPWVQGIEEKAFARSLDRVRKMSPKAILSDHLPPAFDMTDPMLSALEAARAAEPFVGPDQEGFQQILAQMTEGAPVSR